MKVLPGSSLGPSGWAPGSMSFSSSKLRFSSEAWGSGIFSIFGVFALFLFLPLSVFVLLSLDLDPTLGNSQINLRLLFCLWDSPWDFVL